MTAFILGTVALVGAAWAGLTVTAKAVGKGAKAAFEQGANRKN
jgi:hypothetical protein